ERQVRDPARGARPWTALLDQRQRIDERPRVAVVLLDPGRHGEYVRVEDDVLGLEALVAQEPECALADLDLALDRDRLPFLVERHHDGCRTEPSNCPRLLEKRLLALFQADRVGDPFPLDALQAGLDRGEARAVDHDRYPRD